ncbi:DUF619-domain-containing protein [Linderina pennispora]|uniref:Amino-acid acetyltransferase, mitochondrial n=1 Tax=Linderina pennispora TaxID=61395 RepID=A0A1Y1W5I7_9FUNG|nr:DUF619-domain-containing protein [Linderina pennispora]ORX68474.1 DUF619-domain-containing protein [Linderina pennispora]
MLIRQLLAQIQRLGVTPIVLVADEDADGYRDVIKRVHRLADAIEREAGRARPLNEGVFYSNPYTDSQLSVDPELIGSAIAQNQIPLISPLVADAKLQLQVLGISSAAPALARALASSTSAHSPMAGTRGDFSLLLARLIFLGRHDGVDARGFQRFVNLEADYEKVYSECLQKDTLALMRQCLGIFPPTAAGIVASVYSDPALVMKGLISEKPVSAQHRNAARKVKLTERKMSGTPLYTPLANYPFVKIGEDRPAPAAAAPKRPTQFTLLRHGFQIQSHTDLSTCDLPRLRQLLEDSFKRTLNASAYFSRLQELSQHGGIRIIVAGNYQGAVIVTKEPLGNGRYLAYLDKFAVAPTVQGTGMADILWAQLQSACPECLWRSRSDNGVNPWYFDRAHGHFRAPVPDSGTRWVFFWYQQETPAMAPEEIQAGIEVAGRIPASFE